MTAPVRVVAVDLAGPLPAVDSAGGRYQRVRLFLFRGHCPVGDVSALLPAAGLTPGQVRTLIESAGVLAAPEPPEVSAPVDALASVVVATDLTRPELLRRCLTALARQDHPRYEIVVVANGPEREFPSQAIAAVPGARVVVEPRRGASRARNRGVAEAAGTIVAFTDDDAVPEPWWLRSITQRFAAEPDAGCVTGLVLPAQLETEAQVWFEESGNAFHQRYRPASFAGGPYEVRDRLSDESATQSVYAMGPFGTGCNMAFRREVLAQLGGFDEALGPGTPARAGEDLLLFLRLLASGGRLAYEPSAVVWHSHRALEAELRRQVTGYGRGFTAMLTAAVLREPRHLRGLAAMGVHRRSGQPRGLRGRGARRGHGVAPRWLNRARRRGEFVGPMAYLVSRLRLHRWWRQ